LSLVHSDNGNISQHDARFTEFPAGSNIIHIELFLSTT
jgi:hypothetical protein